MTHKHHTHDLHANAWFVLVEKPQNYGCKAHRLIRDSCAILGEIALCLCVKFEVIYGTTNSIESLVNKLPSFVSQIELEIRFE